MPERKLASLILLNKAVVKWLTRRSNDPLNLKGKPMARLLVLRHGKTEIVSKSGEDFDRELVSRGIRNSTDMGALLRRHMPRPEMVMVSPAKRTRQTAHHVLSTLAPDIEPVIDDRIYNASGDTLFEVLTDYAHDCKTAMFVGHNPGMILLIQMMLAAEDEHLFATVADYPTCTLTDLVFDADTIGDIKPGQGKLLSLLRPREIGFNPA